MQFGIFGKKGQQLKYVVRGSTHTTDNLYKIPSVVINRLEKLTSRKPTFHYERVKMSTPTMQTP